MPRSSRSRLPGGRRRRRAPLRRSGRPRPDRGISGATRPPVRRSSRTSPWLPSSWRIPRRPYPRALWKASAVAETRGWRLWWAKRRWYERNHRRLRRWRIDRHAARCGFFRRHPIEGEVLEALDQGRLTIGAGSLLEPGCWLTMAPGARIAIGEGCFLNRNTMLAAQESIEIGDHTMLANGCFVGDAEHRFDDP